MNVEETTKKVLNGYNITKRDATLLLEAPLDKLTHQADIIRKHFCGNNFDVCTIINIKNGMCSEDCKFCAQSTFYDTDIESYPLLSNDKLKKQTLDVYDYGLKRISFVSSGYKLTGDEFKQVLESITSIKECRPGIKLCVSLGMLSKNQITKLEKSGIDRIHNNLESSQTYFASVCSTHTYEDKLNTLAMIDSNNINICSGGIFGLGESWQDRIELAMTLKKLDVKSIPINILNPIKNTPLEDNQILSNEDVCRIVSLFRFINPDAYIRLAGGRLLLEDNGRRAFQSGANAAILGNMLTTMGPSYESDLNMIKMLGYEVTYSI